MITVTFNLNATHEHLLKRLAEALSWPVDRVVQAAVQYAFIELRMFARYLETGKRLETEYCLTRQQIEAMFGEKLTRHLAVKLRELGFRQKRKKIRGKVVRVWARSRVPELRPILDEYLRQS